jgi:hypothetical protein
VEHWKDKRGRKDRPLITIVNPKESFPFTTSAKEVHIYRLSIEGKIEIKLLKYLSY